MGSEVERIDRLHFLAGCRKRRQNQIISIFSISIGFWVCIFNYSVKTTFCWVCVNVSLRFYVCCVLSVGGCWLIYHYLPSDWLERLLWGSLIVARGLSLRSTGDRVFMTKILAWRFLYTAAPWPRVDSMSTWTQVWRPTCYTTTLRHSSVCLSWKIPGKFIRLDNSILWDRFALPNTTRDSDHCWLRIYEWIPYRHCRMSVQYCCVLVFSIVS